MPEEDDDDDEEEDCESMALSTTSCPCGSLRKDSLYSSMGVCESTAHEMLYLSEAGEKHIEREGERYVANCRQALQCARATVAVGFVLGHANSINIVLLNFI